MTVNTIKMTAVQFLQLGEDPPGVRLELVDGEIANTAARICSSATVRSSDRTIFSAAMYWSTC